MNASESNDAIWEEKSPSQSAHRTLCVLIPHRQAGDILYQYVTTHISSCPASALPDLPQRKDFLPVAWWARLQRWSLMKVGVQCAHGLRAPCTNPSLRARGSRGTSLRVSHRFFEMFLFITFLSCECAGRVRASSRLVVERAPPRPTIKQSESPSQWAARRLQIYLFTPVGTSVSVTVRSICSRG